jgi:hypothetical protein
MHRVECMDRSCPAVVQSGVRSAARTRRRLELLPHILAADPEAEDGQRKAQHSQPARRIGCSAAARLATSAISASGPTDAPHLELTTSGRAPAQAQCVHIDIQTCTSFDTNSSSTACKHLHANINVSAQSAERALVYMRHHAVANAPWNLPYKHTKCQLTVEPSVRACCETTGMGACSDAPHGVRHAHFSAEHLAVGVQRIALQDLLTSRAVVSGASPHSAIVQHCTINILSAQPCKAQEAVPASRCNVRQASLTSKHSPCVGARLVKLGLAILDRRVGGLPDRRLNFLRTALQTLRNWLAHLWHGNAARKHATRKVKHTEALQDQLC